MKKIRGEDRQKSTEKGKDMVAHLPGEKKNLQTGVQWPVVRPDGRPDIVTGDSYFVLRQD